MQASMIGVNKHGKEALQSPLPKDGKEVLQSPLPKHGGQVN